VGREVHRNEPPGGLHFGAKRTNEIYCWGKSKRNRWYANYLIKSAMMEEELRREVMRWGPVLEEVAVASRQLDRLRSTLLVRLPLFQIT
jgi:hypothetical protein